MMLLCIDLHSWWSGGLCPASGRTPPSSPPTTTFRPRRLCGLKWSPVHWCWHCTPLSTGYAYTPWVRSFNLCSICISVVANGAAAAAAAAAHCKAAFCCHHHHAMCTCDSCLMRMAVSISCTLSLAPLPPIVLPLYIPHQRSFC